MGTENYLNYPLSNLFFLDQHLFVSSLPSSSIPSTAYLKPNVHLVTEGIEEFTEKGIRTKDGVEREADIIILATGFDMLHSLFPIYGRDKERHMAEIWGDEPRTYLGVTCPSE